MCDEPAVNTQIGQESGLWMGMFRLAYFPNSRNMCFYFLSASLGELSFYSFYTPF